MTHKPTNESQSNEAKSDQSNEAKSIPMELSTGSIGTILTNVIFKTPQTISPTLQVNFLKQSAGDNYYALLVDGKINIFAYFTTPQCKQLIGNGTIKEGSIIRVTKFAVVFVKDVGRWDLKVNECHLVKQLNFKVRTGVWSREVVVCCYLLHCLHFLLFCVF